jgi:Ca2+-binding RTX toxin-like protein
LTGGSGADHFLFTSGSPFIGSQLGVDTLLDFNPSEDRLRLGLATFSALPAATALEAAAFAVVGSDDEASSSTALITYNSANGGLFYNPNGASPGFAAPTGDSAAGGGLFARLLGSASGAAFPALSAAAFDLV